MRAIEATSRTAVSANGTMDRPLFSSSAPNTPPSRFGKQRLLGDALSASLKIAGGLDRDEESSMGKEQQHRDQATEDGERGEQGEETSGKEVLVHCIEVG